MLNTWILLVAADAGRALRASIPTQEATREMPRNMDASPLVS